MPTVNMKVFEESRRHQVVQKYEIYPLNAIDVKDYQIQLTGMASSILEDARIIQNDAQLDQWVESKGNVWSKLAILKAKTPQIILGLSGNPSAINTSDGVVTFISFFDGDSAGWVEVDPNSHISFANNRLEWSGLGRNEDAYVYQSNDNLNDNLIIEHTVMGTDFPGVNGLASNGTLSDEIDDALGMANGIIANRFYEDNVPNVNILNMKMVNHVSVNGNSVIISEDVQYWITAIKSTSLVTKIYSDSTRETLVGTSTVADITGVPNTMQYIYILQSYNSASAYYTSGWLDDFRVRKYTANEPIVTNIKQLNRSSFIKSTGSRL